MPKRAAHEAPGEPQSARNATAANHPTDAAGHLLRLATSLLPAHRREWGRAMRAELAAIEPGPVRWPFAIGCLRATLIRPTTIAVNGGRVLAVAVVATALLLAGQIRYADVRGGAIAMVTVLAGGSWLVCRRFLFGPAGDATARLVRAAGLVLVATDGLLVINELRTASALGGEADRRRTELAIWTSMLAIYLIALVRVTAGKSAVNRRTLATGTAVGLTAVAGWVATSFWMPDLPTSNTSALAFISAAGVVTAFQLAPLRRGQDWVGALWAATIAAPLIGFAIDALPALSTLWVSTSAPPISLYLPSRPHRLVDSVGLWLIGTLIAVFLTGTIRSNRRRRDRSVGLSGADRA